MDEFNKKFYELWDDENDEHLYICCGFNEDRTTFNIRIRLNKSGVEFSNKVNNLLSELNKKYTIKMEHCKLNKRNKIAFIDYYI